MRYTATITGDPRTKKNHMQLAVNRSTGRTFPVQNTNYINYELSCKAQLMGKLPKKPFSEKINLKAVYFMKTKRKVDLCNLLGATCDILTSAGVIEDDNVNIVASHDGSRVFYDKDNPRVEIEITKAED